MTTDLTITGKAAQFGRGVMQDVAGRIIDQFSGNLAASMAAAGAAGVAAAAATGADGEAVAAAAPPAPPKAAEAIDLGSVATAPILKRALPVVIGIVVVVALIIWLRK